MTTRVYGINDAMRMVEGSTFSQGSREELQRVALSTQCEQGLNGSFVVHSPLKENDRPYRLIVWVERGSDGAGYRVAHIIDCKTVAEACATQVLYMVVDTFTSDWENESTHDSSQAALMEAVIKELIPYQESLK